MILKLRKMKIIIEIIYILIDIKNLGRKDGVLKI